MVLHHSNSQYSTAKIVVENLVVWGPTRILNKYEDLSPTFSDHIACTDLGAGMNKHFSQFICTFITTFLPIGMWQNPKIGQYSQYTQLGVTNMLVVGNYEAKVTRDPFSVFLQHMSIGALPRKNWEIH